MKTLQTIFLSAMLVSGAFAGSAYEALRVVGKERGDAVLDGVIEVRGFKGAPDPAIWKVVVREKQARGGVREFDVRGSKIVGERTPTHGTTGKSLNLNQLNLDSDGAHTVSEKESKKTAFAYDHVDYALRAGNGAGAPVWELRLVDERTGDSATVSIAADSGKMLSTSGLEGGRPARVAENERPRRGTRPPEPGEEDARRDRETVKPPEIDKPGTKVTRFIDRASRHIGGAFQRFGDKVNGAITREPRPPVRRATPRPAPRAVPEQSRTYRDANGTEFYRPRD